MKLGMLTPETSSDPRWRAIATRDASKDGAFVYGVTSTRIYCRPSCPSRRPRADRVRFFADEAAAEAAGYRACRRCGGRRATHPRESRAVSRVRAYLDAHPGGRAPLGDLARVAGLSPPQIQRRFTAEVGMTPRAYLASRRVARAKRALRAGTPPATAAFDAGYESLSHAYEELVSFVGMTPREFGKGGLGRTITYAVRSCVLGRVLVAATDRGVCGVALGDDDGALVRWLQAEYPAATIVAGRLASPAWFDEVLQRAAGRSGRIVVPVDVPGTVFERRVWQALLRIPRGTTSSYGAVAAALDAPRAARAVGRASARNPVALLVPCHRVVARDGTTGGYRWGPNRKRALLEREGRASS